MVNLGTRGAQCGGQPGRSDPGLVPAGHSPQLAQDGGGEGGEVTVWNTVHLGRAIDALRARGERIGTNDLAALSPLGWKHVSITGDYVWEDQTRLDPDGFRPLVMPA
jgi:hypothetical protein